MTRLCQQLVTRTETWACLSTSWWVNWKWYYNCGWTWLSCYRLDLAGGLSGRGWKFELAAEAPREEISCWPGVEESMYWKGDVKDCKLYYCSEWLHIYVVGSIALTMGLGGWIGHNAIRCPPIPQYRHSPRDSRLCRSTDESRLVLTCMGSLPASVVLVISDQWSGVIDSGDWSS